MREDGADKDKEPKKENYENRKEETKVKEKKAYSFGGLKKGFHLRETDPESAANNTQE